MLRKLIKWSFIASFWGVILGICVIIYHILQMPKVEGLLDPMERPLIHFYDMAGDEFAVIGGDVREVQSEQIPDHLKAAVVCIEDERFYDHFGVDIKGLARAMAVNIKAGRVVQGGSTISQQLAKNLFLSSKKNMSRKVQEAILALWLEYTYDKDQIITAYLNRVYFGAGAYGVDAASRKYFGKEVSQINVGEAAILAGLLKAPSRLSPFNDIEAAQKRAKLVLLKMQEKGYLFEKNNIDSYLVKNYHPEQRSRSASVGRYFVDYTYEELPYLVDMDEKRDLHVYTTLSLQDQKFAQEKLEQYVNTYGKEYKFDQASFVMMDLDGAIMTLVGGKNYNQSNFNRATRALRQPGSGFKGLYYLAALEKGFSPESIFLDAPIDLNGWKPRNISRNYRGEVDMATSLILSLNTSSVRVLQQTGVRYAIDMIHRLGIESDLRADLSLALGTSEVTLLELTRAYTTIGNGGHFITPYSVTRVLDERGTELYARHSTYHKSLFSEQSIIQINEMLERVVTEGTGRKARLQTQTAGKTGTSQDCRDNWFIGYTRYFSAGVWMGNDNNAPMAQTMTGGNLPPKLFKEIMTHAHRYETPDSLYVFGHGYQHDSSQSIDTASELGDIGDDAFSIEPINSFVQGSDHDHDQGQDHDPITWIDQTSTPNPETQENSQNDDELMNNIQSLIQQLSQ